MATFTNVENFKHGTTAIVGVKSVTTTETKPHLLSQADGRRADEVVGDLGRTITMSVEIEDQGISYSGFIGFANVDTVTFDTQLDSNSATVKTITATDIVFETSDRTTNQDSPNTITLSGRTANEDDTASVA